MADMKDDAFKAGRAIDYEDKDIGPQWAKVAKDCGAQKPTAVMLAAYDVDALLAIGVARPLARAWGAIFAPSGAPKGKKFKAEKARSYSPSDLVAFIAADPKQEGLRAEYTRRTGGANALFYVGGKIAEAESAERIQRLFDRDPVAPYVVIAGAEVTPTGYPEPDAKEDPEDPYQRGVALGQPGDVSTRLGLSLSGIAPETRQAIACAVENDLSDASKRELLADAAAAKGQSAEQYLVDKPNARRAWPTWTKPTLMLARSTRNPPSAGGDVAVVAGPVSGAPVPLVVILGHRTKAYPSVRQALVPLQRAGILRMWSENDLRAGEFTSAAIGRAHAEAALFLALLDTNTVDNLDDALRSLMVNRRHVVPVLVGHCLTDFSAVASLEILFRGRPYGSGESDGVALAVAVREALARRPAPTAAPRLDINAIHAAIVDAGLASSRSALLAGIPRSFSASLTTVQDDSAQVLTDLGALATVGTLRDGSRPLVTYLRSALGISGQRREAQVFHDALRALGE